MHAMRALAVGALATGLLGCADVPTAGPDQGRASGADATVAATASDAPATVSLIQVDWVAYFVDGVAVLSAPRPTLRFDSVEQVRGNGGCNQFAGKVAVGAQSLAFKGLASTRMACMPAPSGPEDKFFRALESTRAWKISQGELVLLSDNGTELVRLARQVR